MKLPLSWLSDYTDMNGITPKEYDAKLTMSGSKSPGAAYADVVLQCGSLEGPLQGGSVAARVAQLYLMDVLFHEVCRRDVQGSAETREAVAEVLSDKHI